MAEEKTETGYPCRARKMAENGWFYEDRSGLHVYQQGPGINYFMIPWRKVEKALANHKNAQAKRKRARNAKAKAKRRP